MNRSPASAAADSSASASVPAGIRLQDRVRGIAEPLLRIGREGLGRRLLLPEHDARAHFVRVPAGKERDLRLPARGERRGDRFRQEIAVDVGREPGLHLHRGLQHLVARLSAKRGERLGAERRRQRLALLLRCGERAERQAAAHALYEVRAALADRFVKEPARARRRHECAHRERSRRLPEDRHVARIAAERGDVVAHPLERRDLIEHPVVARRAAARLARELGVREETERAEPVVDRDEHDVPLRERLAVVPRFGAGASLKPSAVDPHHHRQTIGGRLCRRPEVQRQAVLAQVLEDDVAEDLSLQAAWPERRGVANALPRLHRARRLPAQRSNRRRGIRNRLEDPDAAVRARRALDQAAGRLHLRGCRPACR